MSFFFITHRAHNHSARDRPHRHQAWGPDPPPALPALGSDEPAAKFSATTRRRPGGNRACRPPNLRIHLYMVQQHTISCNTKQQHQVYICEIRPEYRESAVVQWTSWCRPAVVDPSPGRKALVRPPLRTITNHATEVSIGA